MCDTVAEYFDGLVDHAADPNNLSGGDAERLYNAGVITDLSDIPALNAEITDEGCELADVVEFTQTASVSGTTVTTTGTVTFPGESAGEVEVVGTFAAGSPQRKTRTVTSGDTVSLSWDVDVTGTKSVCIFLNNILF